MRRAIFSILLIGCTPTWSPPPEFVPTIINAGEFDIFSYTKLTSTTAPIHIYIEGDGHAFTAHGRPTRDPTPRGTLVRDMAMRDSHANVAYIARPCQYIMSPICTVHDWTDGRFSTRIIDAMTTAIKSVAKNRKIVLIGYSGGAMITGIIINKNPDMNVGQWITIAGILDHAAWTEYFGDSPLITSLNMEKIPNIAQIHYCGANDDTIPVEITRKTLGTDQDMIIIPNAGHNGFTDLVIDFAD